MRASGPMIANLLYWFELLAVAVFAPTVEGWKK